MAAGTLTTGAVEEVGKHAVPLILPQMQRLNGGLVPAAREFQEPIAADKKAKRAKYLEL